MMESALALLLLFHCAGVRGTLTWQGQCQPKTSCKECIRSPGCAWCKQQGFLKPSEPTEQRCSSAEDLRSRNCSEGEVINPRSVKEVLKDSEFRSDSDNVVQLRPQKLHLKLRVGVPQTFKVMFKRAEGHPIDLYYLMDLSYSMQDDLENVRKLGQKIFDALRNITPAVRIGFGSFVDKVALPFVNTVSEKLRWPCPNTGRPCQPAFSFKNVLSLTDDAEEFHRRVSKEDISANLDNAEGGFDAMMQAAVCQNHIGWGNVTRILVYASDDTFHTAGDGKMAGIYLPADGKCHLDNEGVYDKDALYDYPSVGHLSEVVSANKIHLIFAVTGRNYDSYMELSKLIPQSVVGALSDDSSNVVQLISEACEKLTSTVILNHQDVPPGLSISYSSHCFTGVHTQGQKRGECHSVQTNQQVNFSVTLSSSACLERTKTFVIKLQGLSEEIQVSVDTECDCNCQDQEEKSPSCSKHGTLICGVCSCDPEHTGQRCECQQKEDEHAALFQKSKCRQTNTSVLCSGHGRCECGRCVCRGQHKGEFCQCDDTSCDHHDNTICGGKAAERGAVQFSLNFRRSCPRNGAGTSFQNRPVGKGTCNCGVCECFPNYTGSACQCSSFRDRCQTGSSGECSNRGLCKCNRCHCEPGFYGEHCAQIEAPCQTYLACARCTLSSVEGVDVHQLCKKTCGAAKLIHANSTLLPCRDADTSFRVELDGRDGSILLYYAHPLGSIYITTVIILSAVLGVLFIGIVLLLFYRLLLEVIYQIQYWKFKKKRQQK
ncbi:integrin beta-7-like [Scleropages formosus]|uniref:integrin beta-7-like n=1 Tax=Scleropages formosus TaxID=113540 RepID=UPI000878D278|nr:integrin beta-7-like [Scleropages formosus]